MSEIWTFSPSSQPLLERCLAAALPEDENIEWLRKFKTKPELVVEIEDNSSTVEVMEFEENIKPNENELSNIEKHYLMSIEESSTVNYSELVEKSKTNIVFLQTLADKLPLPSVEQFCEHILNNPIDGAFIEHFLTIFFVAFLKRHYSRFCIDFMNKISKVYPDYFAKMLKLLLSDDKIPKNIFNDYILSLNESEKTKLMGDLIHIDISSEVFKNHLAAIFTAYKDSKKSDSMQNFIYKSLIKHVEVCKDEKVYGALFLEYLQNEKDLKRETDVRMLAEAIELHRSPFKRACVMILKEISEK